MRIATCCWSCWRVVKHTMVSHQNKPSTKNSFYPYWSQTLSSYLLYSPKYNRYQNNSNFYLTTNHAVYRAIWVQTTYKEWSNKSWRWWICSIVRKRLNWWREFSNCSWRLWSIRISVRIAKCCWNKVWVGRLGWKRMWRWRMEGLKSWRKRLKS